MSTRIDLLCSRCGKRSQTSTLEISQTRWPRCCDKVPEVVGVDGFPGYRSWVTDIAPEPLQRIRGKTPQRLGNRKRAPA